VKKNERKNPVGGTVDDTRSYGSTGSPRTVLVHSVAFPVCVIPVRPELVEGCERI
jgi:hypothetical protein